MPISGFCVEEAQTFADAVAVADHRAGLGDDPLRLADVRLVVVRRLGVIRVEGRASTENAVRIASMGCVSLGSACAAV